MKSEEGKKGKRGKKKIEEKITAKKLLISS